MPRYKQWIEAGPKLSDDRHDKFIAARNWYVGRNKNDPEFARAPHYYAAVSEWFDRLSLDDQERVHTVVYVYSTATGASRRRLSTPPCCRQRPVPPEIIRKAWGHD